MKSIGIYPGTFDLIHEGHVAFALAAINACKLDIIYFTPETMPRNKANVSNIAARMDAIDEMIAPTGALSSISLASERFTVADTLPEIEARLGPASFTLLVGSDVAPTLPDWPAVDVLLSTWAIAIGMRKNDDSGRIDGLFKQIETDSRISIGRSYIYTDKSEISSSDFRKAP